VVKLLPAVQRRRVRALAGYDPATAGGLMSPEFVCLYAQATKQEAIQRIERSRAPADTLAWIYVMNLDRRLKGAIALADLLRADPDATMGDVAGFLPPRVGAEAELEDVARLMTDYDLTVVPVVDEREQIMGVVSVDDVLEMVLPRGWRRRFDLLGGE
jgi:Mg/Co/Ni transporter MgtE